MNKIPIKERREESEENKKLFYALKDLSSGSINKYSEHNEKKSILSMFGIVSPESTPVLVW